MGMKSKYEIAVLLTLPLLLYIISDSLYKNDDLYPRKLEESIHPELLSNKNWIDWIHYSLDLRSLKSFDDSLKDSCSLASKKLNNYYKSGSGIKTISTSGNQNEMTEKIFNIIDGKEISKNIKEYGIGRLIAPIILIVFGIISIFIWILWCFNCCCCKCCCYCCCKKSSCKSIIFIISISFYAVIFGCSIYGLAMSKKLFEGLGDASCSILQFINTIRNGEVKTTLPKWAGIDEIKTILNGLNEFLNDVRNGNYLTPLNGAKSVYEGRKGTFETNIRQAANSICDSSISGSCSINSFSGSNYYYVDDGSTKYHPPFLWKMCPYEYKDTTGNLDNTQLEQCKNGCTNSRLDGIMKIYSNYILNFNNIIQNSHGNFEYLIQTTTDSVPITDAQNKLENLKKPIKKIETKIGIKISDYSLMINDYGKTGFTLFFTVLFIMNSAVIALLLLAIVFNVNCISKLFRLFIHILWNILALIMILGFIIGGAFTLVGIIGKDLVDVISYVLSSKNLDNSDSSPSKIISKDDTTSMLNTCINGNGDIIHDLGLDGNAVAENLDQVSELSNTISQLSNTIVTTTNNINLGIDNYLENVENYINSNGGVFKDQKFFKHNDLNQYNGDNEALRTANKANGKLPAMLTQLRDTSASGLGNKENEFKDIGLKAKDYFDEAKKILVKLEEKIGNVLGNEGIFSLVNCGFIGKNVKVMLTMFKQGLGDNFYSVGIVLGLISCSIMMATSYLLLTLAILDIKPEKPENKEIQNDNEKPHFASKPGFQNIPVESNNY